LKARLRKFAVFFPVSRDFGGERLALDCSHYQTFLKPCSSNKLSPTKFCRGAGPGNFSEFSQKVPA
jgi:hypothetical protein